MITGLKFNPITGQLDQVSKIPQLDADPASPKAEDAWVLKSGGGGGAGGGVIIAPLGLGFVALTPGSGGGASTYQFSFRTQEGTTIRVALS